MRAMNRFLNRETNWQASANTADSATADSAAATNSALPAAETGRSFVQVKTPASDTNQKHKYLKT
ncbi:hypothetical protein RQN30_10990 [Arcanobacterium hippocoleae]